MIGKRKIRSLVLRNYLSLSLVFFAFFTFLIVMFGFDLEDQIFDLQVSRAAEKLIEAQHFEQQPSGTAQTLEMQYFLGTQDMPDWMSERIDPSCTDRNMELFAEEKGHFHLAIRSLDNGQKLYLLFNARQYIRSTKYIMAFLQFIGGLAAIVLAVSLFFVIRMTRKVSIPLETMAAELAEGDPGSANFTLPGQAPLELHTLAKAIEDRDKRIQSLLERERVFNRDASHELRTPLAVARGAVEVIEETGLKGNAFTRLQSSLQDMQLLTEGILWLGREPNHTEGCDISAICKNSMETYKHLTGNRDILVRLEAPENVQIPVPEPVAQVLVGNLLRNAIAYTDKGEVCLSVRKGTLLVTDTGVGFGRASDNRTGFGVGLSLVKRLCTHFGIAFEIKPLEPNGSVASLTWTKQSDPV